MGSAIPWAWALDYMQRAHEQANSTPHSAFWLRTTWPQPPRQLKPGAVSQNQKPRSPVCDSYFVKGARELIISISIFINYGNSFLFAKQILLHIMLPTTRLSKPFAGRVSWFLFLFCNKNTLTEATSQSFLSSQFKVWLHDREVKGTRAGSSWSHCILTCKQQGPCTLGSPTEAVPPSQFM